MMKIKGMPLGQSSDGRWFIYVKHPVAIHLVADGDFVSESQ